ncbi:MAG: peptidase MA family metallohydrolase [Polyangiaceae bacterium]
MRSLSRAFLFVLAFFFAVTFGSSARALPTTADDDSESTNVIAAPRDEPLVLQPEAVTIPKVPAEYTQKDLGWMTFSYPPGSEERVESALHDAAKIKSDLERTLGQKVLTHVDVRIARTWDEMAKLAPEQVPPPAYATGVAYSSLHLVLITLTAPGPATDGTDVEEVFRHELAHIALQDATLGHHVPRWFNEGFAIHASGESPYLRWKTLENASLAKQILPLSELDEGFPNDNYEVSVAYAESADFVRFLVRDGDEGRFSTLVSHVREGTPFERALGDAYTTNLRKLEFQWREDLSRRFTLLPVILGGSMLWVLMAGILVLAYVKKRRKAKETLVRWEREERALEAARARLLEEVAKNDVADMVGPPQTLRPAGLPKIEHDGNWHTLH